MRNELVYRYVYVQRKALFGYHVRIGREKRTLEDCGIFDNGETTYDPCMPQARNPQ